MPKEVKRAIDKAFSGLAETWASATGVFIVVSIFLALAITAAGGWPVFLDWMKSEKAAYWVQAIGAILAVVAAFTISNAQFKAATNLEEEKSRRELERRQAILLALIESALDEYNGALDALRGDDPLDWFNRTSASELMKEYYDSFAKFSPLDMPSAAAVRSLITLRDRLQAASWNATRALHHGKKMMEDQEVWSNALAAARAATSACSYDECVVAMNDNLAEVASLLADLRAEFS